MIADPARVRAAVRARALGHIPDGHFDEMCRRVCAAYHCSAAFVSLLDDRHQILKGMSGLSEKSRELDLDFSICQYVVVDGRPLEFPDTSVAPELARCRATEHIGAYFGHPLTFEDQRVGAVGLIDHHARPDLEGRVNLEPYVLEATAELERRARTRRA